MLTKQVNEKFHKLERVYRDCIKTTKDKTRIIQYTARCTRRLMHSDQTKKYGISESIIQALYYDIVGNKIIIRACIMDSEMPYFFVWSISREYYRTF